ncbi:hypothetical protein ACUXQ2_005747 [Cupriavidus metallidurans]
MCFAIKGRSSVPRGAVELSVHGGAGLPNVATREAEGKSSRC